MAKKTALISGAGIAGPTLAYWLWRRRFEPVLIEWAPKFRAGGYVIDFWGVGFDVAERMELIRCLGKAIHGITVFAAVNIVGERRTPLHWKTCKLDSS